MTAKDLISGAMRLIGAIASGETPSASELTDGLSSLNDMLESWSNDELMIEEIKREEFDLTASKQMYTMGPLGDFDTVRAMDIEGAGYIQNGAEIPIKVLTIQEWQGVTVKSTSSNVPTKLYSDNTAPLRNIYVWPIPSETNKLVLYSRKTLQNFANAIDEVSLPPGYARAIKYNLALELAPEYGKDPSALVVSTAIESKNAIQRANFRPGLMTSDTSGLGGNKKSYNIITGE